AGPVATPVGALELDPEPVLAKCGQQPFAQRLGSCGVVSLPATGESAVTGAARKADQTFRQLFDLLQRDPRLSGRALRIVTRPLVRLGEDPAQIAVPACVLNQESEMERLFRPSGNGHLGSRDRPYAEPLAGVRELHRAPDPVVVSERQGRIAEVR